MPSAGRDEDATIRLPPASHGHAPRARSSVTMLAGAGVLGSAVAIAALLAGSWWLWVAFAPPEAAAPPRRPPAIPPIAAVPAPPSPAIPAITTTDEAGILAAADPALALFHFAPAPSVLVAVFPTYHAQARGLNRAAAFLEVEAMPHDHVLDWADLDARLARRGVIPDMLYSGHDYRAADLARFFAKAAAEGRALSDEEAQLRAVAAHEGWLATTPPTGALIALPSASAVPDSRERATILRHELSHGAFFTDPAYAAYARGAWTHLTSPERDAIRRFLTDTGYDPEIDELMTNEMQAYLFFTPDRRFFRADAIGMTPARLDAVRRAYRDGIAPRWLRDNAAVEAAQ